MPRSPARRVVAVLIAPSRRRHRSLRQRAMRRTNRSCGFRRKRPPAAKARHRCGTMCRSACRPPTRSRRRASSCAFVRGSPLLRSHPLLLRSLLPIRLLGSARKSSLLVGERESFPVCGRRRFAGRRAIVVELLCVAATGLFRGQRSHVDRRRRRTPLHFS